MIKWLDRLWYAILRRFSVNGQSRKDQIDYGLEAQKQFQEALKQDPPIDYSPRGRPRGSTWRRTKTRRY